MAFEVFKKGSAPVSTVPTATIQKRGLISLNRAAYSLVGEPEAVELLWDKDRQIVGIRPAALESPNAYPARPQSSTGKGPILIAGNLFTKFIALDTSEAQRWVPVMEDGILCIDLAVAGQRVTSNRSRPVARESTSQ